MSTNGRIAVRDLILFEELFKETRARALDIIDGILDLADNIVIYNPSLFFDILELNLY